MIIRQANFNDIEEIVKIDKKAYGKDGASVSYFSQKMRDFPEGILLVEKDNEITGFAVFQIYNKNDIPKDFANMKVEKEFSGKWCFIIGFTTATNYKNKIEDSKLLNEIENIAKNKRCEESCIESIVPLSKDHPFENNGVFEFWNQNGYKKCGTIDWVSNSSEFVNCWLLKKNL